MFHLLKGFHWVGIPEPVLIGRAIGVPQRDVPARYLSEVEGPSSLQDGFWELHVSARRHSWNAHERRNHNCSRRYSRPAPWQVECLGSWKCRTRFGICGVIDSLSVRRQQNRSRDPLSPSSSFDLHAGTSH